MMCVNILRIAVFQQGGVFHMKVGTLQVILIGKSHYVHCFDKTNKARNIYHDCIVTSCWIPYIAEVFNQNSSIVDLCLGLFC